MHTPEKNVKIAGRNYTVPADVQPMHFMPAVLSVEFTNRDVNFSESVWNAPS